MAGDFVSLARRSGVFSGHVLSETAGAFKFVKA